MSVNFDVLESDTSLARPPSSLALVVDRLFFGIAAFAAFSIIALVAYILYEIGGQAMPAISNMARDSSSIRRWDVQKAQFGILPQIWGTLYSSLLALLIGGFVGVTIAIFLTQDFLPPRFAVSFRTLIELLAAIPSVVYGLWGIFVVIPFVRPPANWLHEHLGASSPSSRRRSAVPACCRRRSCLPIMVLPTISAISRDALGSCRPSSTRPPTAWARRAGRRSSRSSCRPPSSGIFGALILGFGRALGETMALAMLVGNANQIVLVAVLAGEHAGRAARLQLPRSGAAEVRR